MRSIYWFNTNTGHIFRVFVGSVGALCASCSYAG